MINNDKNITFDSMSRMLTDAMPGYHIIGLTTTKYAQEFGYFEIVNGAGQKVANVTPYILGTTHVNGSWQFEPAGAMTSPIRFVAYPLVIPNNLTPGTEADAVKYICEWLRKLEVISANMKAANEMIDAYRKDPTTTLRDRRLDFLL